MIDDILNYDPQLEIKVINLLFRLELYSPEVIYRKITKVLDFKNRWNIWLLGRNFYHVCYGRPRLVVSMCKLASLARNDVIKLSKKNHKNSARFDYEMEWNSALSIQLVTENDGFLSCAPPESVFFYGFLCYYKIVDPTLRFEAIEKKYNTYQDSNKIEKEIIIHTLLPLLLSCFNIFKEKFPDFLNTILTFIQQNNNQQSTQNNTFNYNLIFTEIQNFLTMKCDIKNIIPFVLIQQSDHELEEQKDLYIKASERKASLLYQQKKAKDHNFDKNGDGFIEIDNDIEIDLSNDGDDESESENEDRSGNVRETSKKENNKNKNNNNENNNNINENNININESNVNENNNNINESNVNENNNNNENLITNSSENVANDSKDENDSLPASLYLSFSHQLHKIISVDDVDSLQQLSTRPGFTFDFRVDTSLACCYELLMKKPTLIQLSSFYGSLKCFKYLYLNKASLFLNDFNEEMPNSIASFAISGGNIEIIRILISSKVDFSSALFTSVSYHRDDLFFWFIENMGSEGLNVNDKFFDGMSLMHFAAESNNLNIAQYLIESDIKIGFLNNYDEDNIETAFNLACNYDCVGIVELICNHYLDQIPKEALFDGLSVCIASNAADSFSFLLKFTETMKCDGSRPFKISLDEIKELKEKHSSDGFDELNQESLILKILNDFENKIISSNQDQ